MKHRVYASNVTEIDAFCLSMGMYKPKISPAYLLENKISYYKNIKKTLKIDFPRVGGANAKNSSPG